MFTDIFSSFDPATSSLYPSMKELLFWSPLMVIILFKNNLWLPIQSKSWLLNMVMNNMEEQASRTSTPHMKGFSSLLVPLFLLLISINLMGLVPYVPSASSHIIFSLSFGLPLWFMIILSASVSKPSMFFAHLLPSGAPTLLNPFLVVIETVSILVRPITLSFRLAANMTAGHIMLSLASTFLMSSIMLLNVYSSVSLILISSFYFIFEMAICLIQAYIFCLLLTLYMDDHPL